VPRLQLDHNSPAFAFASDTLSRKYKRIGAGSQLLSMDNRVRKWCVSQERAGAPERTVRASNLG